MTEATKAEVDAVIEDAQGHIDAAYAAQATDLQRLVCACDGRSQGD
jgi:hypothetical protein